MKANINHLIFFILLFSLINNNIVTKNILCENVGNVKEATDCFNTQLDEDYETCCFFEFKDNNKYVRERYCMPLNLQQFLQIHDTIKEIEKDKKNIKIYSLECDKCHYIINSNILMFILIFLLILNI